jgi:hypothetical protein
VAVAAVVVLEVLALMEPAAVTVVPVAAVALA